VRCDGITEADAQGAIYNFSAANFTNDSSPIPANIEPKSWIKCIQSTACWY
jgi:hypothetical protein